MERTSAAWAAAAVVALFAAPALSWAGEAEGPVQGQAVEDITGLYRCLGQAPQGAVYEGTVAIRKVGETYELRWTVGRESHVGIGILEGNVLASSWHIPGKQPVLGIVVYKIEAGPKLVGKYSSFPGGRTFPETLTFMKRLAEPPPQRQWKAGDRALVHWSRDEFWYPATIVQKDGDRYYVRFDDGDKEWTDASRIREDDVREGERVSVSRAGPQEGYVPATVVKRDGRNITVRFENGARMTTTISRVRVVRPEKE